MRCKEKKVLEEREFVMQRFKIFDPEIGLNTSASAATAATAATTATTATIAREELKTLQPFSFWNLKGSQNNDLRTVRTITTNNASEGLDAVTQQFNSINLIPDFDADADADVDVDDKVDKDQYNNWVRGSNSRIFDCYNGNIQAFPFRHSPSTSTSTSTSNSNATNGNPVGAINSINGENGKKSSSSSSSLPTTLQLQNNDKLAVSATHPVIVKKNYFKFLCHDLISIFTCQVYD